jgi:hypothetical protein
MQIRVPSIYPVLRLMQNLTLVVSIRLNTNLINFGSGKSWISWRCNTFLILLSLFILFILSLFYLVYLFYLYFPYFT